MASASTASRVYLTLIGLGLALVGGLFFALMWRSYQRACEVEAWPVVPCVILSSGAEERQIDPNGPIERRFAVLYGYEWEGVPRESERLSLRGGGWSSQDEKLQVYEDRYPQGSTQQCHVNPSDPDFAVLQLESKAPGYSLWFPALFVVGGLGIMAGAWRR
ncbi:DUF3592 domain-containing protein [Luteolibacter marinus]|uniref:DUF3592 domain-containing protein n=1 Tax=Luteolibacter marinus TaxID=2776705 RepID=UPI001868540C|nr:DUF3592 domain-containing protein [Luteolibacter marinus]